MRTLLVSSLGVVSSAALLLPLTLPAHARTADAGTSPSTSPAAAEPRLPGATRSLPLSPGGLEPRTVEPFSLLGVVWDDAKTPLGGRIQVRTRAAERGGGWSSWRELSTHPEHAGHSAPGSGTATRHAGGTGRGATTPLWVGESDAVQVRVGQQADAGPALPEGARLELVDPGEHATTRAGGQSGTRIAALSKSRTEAAAARQGFRPGKAGEGHIGPRPGIVTRKGWGANASWRDGGFVYSNTVKMAFVHHTAESNDYRCSQAPSIIRGIYRYHVRSSGWRDMGYNFLIDKCGTIYEGRAGGVREPVRGAHTLGFNADSMGIAVLGNFENTRPPADAVTAVAKLTGWKLGLYGVNPRGRTTMNSGGGKFPKGKNVRMRTISGHRDGYNTACPGRHLYRKLGSVRRTAAALQGR